MKAIYLVAAAALAAGTGNAQAESVFREYKAPATISILSRSAAPQASLSSALDMLLPGRKGGWYPEKIVTQSYDYETSGWVTTASTEIGYDDIHRITSVVLSVAPAVESPAYLIALGYDTEKSALPDTVTISAFSNPQLQYHVTYDEKVADYPVRVEARTMLNDGDWSDWSTALDVDVRRDDKGRVVAVTPKVIAISDFPVEYEKLEVTYGEQFPVAIKSYVADTDETGAVEFEDMVELTNMEFEACDNQILRLTDLYTAPNQLTACKMTDADGADLTMAFTYGEVGNFTATSTGMEDGEPISSKLEMVYTDANGSYTRTQTTQYPQTGFFEEEYEKVVFNEFGLVEEMEISESDTDPAAGPMEEDLFMKGTTDYWEISGMPCEYIRSVKVAGTDTFAPILRQLFDGYEPSTGISLPAAAQENTGRKGIYTIEGRRMPEGTALAPGFYIINGVRTLVR